MKNLVLKKKNLTQIKLLTKGWNKSWWDNPIDQMSDHSWSNLWY